MFWGSNPSILSSKMKVVEKGSKGSKKGPKKGSENVNICKFNPKEPKRVQMGSTKGTVFVTLAAFLVKVTPLVKAVTKGSKLSKMGPKGSKKGPKGSEKGPKKTPF